MTFIYALLDGSSVKVSRGARVNKGQKIGKATFCGKLSFMIMTGRVTSLPSWIASGTNRIPLSKSCDNNSLTLRPKDLINPVPMLLSVEGVFCS